MSLSTTKLSATKFLRTESRPELTDALARADQGIFSFQCKGLASTALRVFRVQGSEHISKPFRFDITLVAESSSLDLHAAIAKRATLTMQGHDASGHSYRRHIHGRVESCSQLSAGKRSSQYQLRLSPSLFPLAYTRNSRVFRRLSVVEIAEKVLTEGRLKADQISRQLHGQYARREFCVQYQESDLAFISRLLEDEGIFYFFRHEHGRDVIVLADGSHAIEPLPHAAQLPYRDQPHRYEEVIHGLQSVAQFRSGATILRDYRFKQPGVDMDAHQHADDFAEHPTYLFPGAYHRPEQGQRLVKIRHEETQCERSQIRAESNSPELQPGHSFQLHGHGRDDLNRGYQIIAVEHHGTQPQALGEEQAATSEPQYHAQVVCIPEGIPYRASRATPRPSIQGIQTAVVVGPPGEEIHCDSHGRVRVQFHWDRQSQHSEDSSCWVRVSHPWAGAGYGAMFIPRVGQEVLVQFLEGDPDRPVIIGRVYNGDNPVPHDLPNHKAVTTLRTASTPGGQGYNEIRFTDTAGHEELFIHAQKNRREIIGHNDNCTIRANRTTAVADQDTLQVGNTLTIQAGSEIILKVGGSTVTVTPSGITMTGTSLTSRASAMDVSAPAIQMNGQVKIN